MSHFSRIAAGIGVAAAVLALPAGASAARDRNHDRIPDRWERAHHLSLKIDQRRRDQDHDGLRNLSEWRNGLDPRDADSDDDGVRDVREDSDGDGVSNGREQRHGTDRPGDGAEQPKGDGDEPRGEGDAPKDGGDGERTDAPKPPPVRLTGGVISSTSAADGGGVSLVVTREHADPTIAVADASTVVRCAAAGVEGTTLCGLDGLVSGRKVLTAAPVVRDGVAHWTFVLVLPAAVAGPPTPPAPPSGGDGPPVAPAITATLTSREGDVVTIHRPNGEDVTAPISDGTLIRCVRVADGHVVSSEPCAASHLVAGASLALAQVSLEGGRHWAKLTVIETAAG